MTILLWCAGREIIDLCRKLVKPVWCKSRVHHLFKITCAVPVSLCGCLDAVGCICMPLRQILHVFRHVLTLRGFRLKQFYQAAAHLKPAAISTLSLIMALHNLLFVENLLFQPSLWFRPATAIPQLLYSQ